METAVKAQRRRGAQAQQILLDQGYRICGQTGHDVFFRDEAPLMDQAPG